MYSLTVVAKVAKNFNVGVHHDIEMNDDSPAFEDDEDVKDCLDATEDYKLTTAASRVDHLHSTIRRHISNICVTLKKNPFSPDKDTLWRKLYIIIRIHEKNAPDTSKKRARELVDSQLDYVAAVGHDVSSNGRGVRLTVCCRDFNAHRAPPSH